MARSFAELRQDGVQQLEQLRSAHRPDLGSHKRTRLARAGCEGSGSLLHRDVAAQHARWLLGDLMVRTGQLTTANAYSRLRLLTVLHCVTRLDADRIVEAVREMESELLEKAAIPDVWVLGSIEIEVISFRLLSEVQAQSDTCARKHSVLQRIKDKDVADTDTGVLVHLHGLVDLGMNSSLRDGQLRSSLGGNWSWRLAPYQIELKRLFGDRPLSENLRDIAAYLTKGGNDTLRYNAGFGRERDDDLDARVWRSGGYNVGDGITDERALTLGEIALLDSAWLRLMGRSRDMRGYLIRSPRLE